PGIEIVHRDQSLGRPKNPFNRGARLLLDLREVLGAAEALGVELVNVLGSRQARREPAAVGYDLDPADRVAAAGGGGEDGADRLAGELAHVDVLRRDAGERRLLGGGGVDVDPIVDRLAERADELAVLLAGVAAGAGGHLGGQKPGDEAVLVGAPGLAVAAQE